MLNADLVDWNIEIAHVNWGSPGAPASVEESLADAEVYFADWRGRGATFVVSALIDDKELRIPNRSKWLELCRQEYEGLFKILDFVCFESDLISLKEEFLSQIQERQRGRIDREMERYRERHGHIACSHDIAIWHLLRLGLLNSARKFLHATNDRRFGFARGALSILEDEDRVAEERARELLLYCKDSTVLSRIECVYYA
jgi:hypothetical protein